MPGASLPAPFQKRPGTTGISCRSWAVRAAHPGRRLDGGANKVPLKARCGRVKGDPPTAAIHPQRLSIYSGYSLRPGDFSRKGPPPRDGGGGPWKSEWLGVLRGFLYSLRNGFLVRLDGLLGRSFRGVRSVRGGGFFLIRRLGAQLRPRPRHSPFAPAAGLPAPRRWPAR